MLQSKVLTGIWTKNAFVDMVPTNHALVLVLFYLFLALDCLMTLQFQLAVYVNECVNF